MMNTYEYVGVVEFVGEVKSFGQNGFTKRDLVIGNDVDEPSRFPNPVLFSFKKERCALCDSVKKGDRVKVVFLIDGRRWDGPDGTRYFTDLTGWKLEKLGASDGMSAMAPTAVPPPPQAPSHPTSQPAPSGSEEFLSDPENMPF